MGISGSRPDTSNLTCQTQPVTKVFAHRGAHENERENTLLAFSAAVALGVDGVELDVRLSADGVLVVHHDPVVAGHVIARSEARVLPDYVPTLEASLEALRGISVNVEIKNLLEKSEPTFDATGDFARLVISDINRLGVSDDVVISSFDLATCAVARSFDRKLYVAWLLWDRELLSAMTQAHVLGLNAVNPHFSLLDAGTVDTARALSLDVNAWTVNEESDLLAMADFGVASVITDDPTLAIRLLR